MRAVYFSAKTGNTKRFVDKLGFPSVMINKGLVVNEPFVIFCPTYADNQGKGAVPPQVIEFLKNPTNKGHIHGVVGFGNRNFGKNFAKSADVISINCRVPVLSKIELFGTNEDVIKITKEINSVSNEQ